MAASCRSLAQRTESESAGLIIGDREPIRFASRCGTEQAHACYWRELSKSELHDLVRAEAAVRGRCCQVVLAAALDEPWVAGEKHVLELRSIRHRKDGQLLARR